MGLPSGTVTFLFTDIEGSTALWDAHPESMRTALARHDEHLRACAERHDGQVFSTSGDGMAMAFSRSTDAVAAAVDIQRALLVEHWPGGAVIRVRIGLHTGEAQERDGDYFGPPLNRAARLMAAARGGQILVSGATAAVLDPVPDGIELVDLGSRRLRGISGSTAVFGVRTGDLPEPEPPAADSARAKGNLPHPPTLYVGQALNLKTFASELPGRRLVTLTGPGGVGKTRMAVEAGLLADQDFPEGLWFVELGPVADPGAVPDAVAKCLGAPPQPGASIEASIVDVLRDRRLLLVLDNCEHLLDAVRTLVATIVGACPTVTILATSREPLGLAGERVHVVRSLEPSLEGVELFCERARAVDSAASFGERELATVAEICTRLDGVPLAIELAAARSRSLSPTDLLARLDDRFRVLRGGLRGGAERHQTLQTTVAWSYQLLSEPERNVFDRLSVFSGTFDLASAEAVCAGDGIYAGDVLDILAALVDKSMVTVVRDGGTSRYRLLETLRSYGEERLAERGNPGRVRDRHLARCLDVAGRASALIEGSDPFDGARTLSLEWDNLRSGLEWALGSEDYDSAATLVMATTMYGAVWFQHEHPVWIEQVLARISDDHSDRPLLLAAYAGAVSGQGDQGRAVDLANRALELIGDHDDISSAQERLLAYSRELDPQWTARRTATGHGRFTAYNALAGAYVNSDRAAEALDAARVAEGMAGDDPFKQFMSASLMVWTCSAADPSLVPQYAARIRELAEETGSPIALTIAAFSEGMRDLLAGDGARALTAFKESARLSGEAPFLRGQALQGVAWAASAIGGTDAADAFRAAIVDLYGSRFWMYVWIVLETLGTYWVFSGQSEDGAVVLGHLTAGNHSHATLRGARTAALETLAGHLELSEAMDRGAGMDRDGLVTYVLDRLGADG